LVVHGVLLFERFVASVQQHGLRVPILSRRLAPQLVDRAVARGGDDPAGGTGRDVGRGPPLDRDGECVLDRLLGDVDVAEDADQDRDRASVLLAEDTLDLRGWRAGRLTHSVRGRRAGAGPRLAASWPAPACGPTRALRRGRAP